MCTHAYTSDGNKGKTCPYPDLYRRASEAAIPNEGAKVNFRLPLDNEGACIFHSQVTEWKRENGFDNHFSKLPRLIEDDEQLDVYDFSEFTFVGNHRLSKGYQQRIKHIVFEKEPRFISAHFLDSVSIEGVAFKCGATFVGAIFEKNLNIVDSYFQGLRFSCAQFKQGLRFTGLKIESYAIFDDTCFTRGFIFFNDVKFNGLTSFTNAVFDIGGNGVLQFEKSQFNDFLDFTETECHCQVVFKDVLFTSTTDFVDTNFGSIKSTARYRGSALELNHIEIAEGAVLTFKSTDGQKKMFDHDVQISFKEPPKGLLLFENVNFHMIAEIFRKRLIQLQKSGSVKIGSDCIKYRFQTEVRTLVIRDDNAPLVIELCQTFSQYFTVRNGLNLGFEIVERTGTSLSYIYFTDEDITEETFLDRLTLTEQSLWDLIATRPDLKLLGAKRTEETALLHEQSHTLINTVDGISAMLCIFFRVSIRIMCKTWKASDTRVLLEAIRFSNRQDADERAASLHKAMLANYTLIALADINARQNSGLIPMKSTPKTILFLRANPSGLTNLALEEEAKAIAMRLRQSEFRHAFHVQNSWAVQAPELPGEIMRYSPAILHFSGHGDKQGRLVFQDTYGIASPASKESIAKVFGVIGQSIRCVVLSACFSLSQAELIAEHVDVVVGMEGIVQDPAAINFSAAFYEALANGRDVSTAFEVAKLELDLGKLPDRMVPQMCHGPNVDPKHITFSSVGNRQTEGTMHTRPFPHCRGG